MASDSKYEIVIEVWEHSDAPDYTPTRYNIPKYKRDFNPNLLFSAAHGTLVDTEFGKKELFRVKRGGELGGWVESPLNLSQSGDCWIYPDAIVCGNAVVTGNAQIKGGQIGDRAFIGGDAVVEGDSLIGGSCVVYGKVSSSDLYGTGWYRTVSEAREFPYSLWYGDEEKTEQKEEGENSPPFYRNEAVVVYPDAEVVEDSVVFGRAKIKGLVSHACVCDNAIVYGKVLDGAIVAGTSLVLPQGVVKGKLELFNGQVGGKCEA